MKSKNIRQSSSGQYYLTFVDLNTGEIVLARFLAWSRLLLMYLGAKQEVIVIQGKKMLVAVPEFQFVPLEDYGLLLGDDIILCSELWR